MENVEIAKEVIIREEKKDSLTIKQSAKGQLYYELKVYGDTDDLDNFIKKVNEVKKRVEREVIVDAYD